jgi:hypothetical protein
MAASACCIWIQINDCLDVFSSSQQVLSPSNKILRFFCLPFSFSFFSLSFSCIQSITDDIILIAYRHHFKTHSFTLTRERNTSFSYCQILLVIDDETYEIKERKWLESSTEVCYLGQWFLLSFFSQHFIINLKE